MYGLVRVQRQVVLVIVLGHVERPVPGSIVVAMSPAVDPRGVELGDVGLSDLGLGGVLREDGRAVLRAGVGTLAVELGGVVGDREEDLQQLARS